MNVRLPALLALSAATSACELREITLARPDDVIIAEVVLRAGADRQLAYLHRTSTGESSARVFGARIEVTDVADGSSFIMETQPDDVCLDPAPDPAQPDVGSCYGVVGTSVVISPGRRYTLRIELADGGVLTGSTTVPGDFAVTRPGTGSCALPADARYELVWTRSAGSSVYLIEARMAGLREALRQRGITVTGSGAVDLLGLSITAEDTTLTFPSELGLFDRLEEDLHPLLLAIQGGLPPGVTAELSVAAADRNYVNWIRGGNFNPSGVVRISSLSGDGTGVFGSLVSRDFEVRTDDDVEVPPCPGGGGTDVATLRPR